MESAWKSSETDTGDAAAESPLEETSCTSLGIHYWEDVKARLLDIIFLGAGASAAVGYPAMAGLRTQLLDRIKGDERNLLYELLRSEQSDAETVLQDIESIDSLVKRGLGKIFQGSSYAIFTDMAGQKHTVLFQQFVDLCLSLREEIRDLIFDIYQFRTECVPRLGPYSQLFATFGSKREHHIYTTNYDRIIEAFCARTKGFEVRDGFEYDSKTRTNLWRPVSFDYALPEDAVTVKVLKLHGSLDWKVGESGIERVSPEIRMEQRPTAIHKKDILIYPGSKEPPENEPFRTVYERFETQMKEADRCLVIGFSFRDPYLNRIFRDFVNSGKGHLWVMSKDCKDTVARNLLGLEKVDDLEPYLHTGRFVPIPCHFGEADWLTRLRNIELFP
jgi:hypothetical protein